MQDERKLPPQELLSYFAVGAPYPNVYVLGSFARYVTLYSQQVRALNLVEALLEANVLRSGSKLTIVGAGAAGLTASAAAALAGVDVMVLEELEGPLELQMNNRQRWIHPRIYDWPKSKFEDDRARLPVLDWQAGYAEAVADQIWDDWNRIKEHTTRIQFRPQVSDLYVSPKGGEVIWNEPGHPEQFNRDSTVILATGFGLDLDDVGRGSYWADDDLDNSLRRFEPIKILVVGHGDGALTDVMRLCFRRFRHANITKLFQENSAIEGIKRDLLEIHNQSVNTGTPGDKERIAAEIHQRFRALQTHGLEKTLADLIRKNRPTVYLTGMDGNHYGPTASILNRLILLLLIRQDLVKPVRGPASKTATPVNGKFRVQIEGLGPEATPDFDRVVYRIGPKPALTRFATIHETCQHLKTKWEHLNQFTDPTRHEHQWEFLSDKWPLAKVVPFEQESSVKKLGISARWMSVTKEIRDDGSSTVTYNIRDLSVYEGEIEGVRFLFNFSAGCIGPPELDAAARQIGGTWRPDQTSRAEPENLSERLELSRKHSQEVSGTLVFNPPLGPESPPASFGLRLSVVNGDALSSWEFEQLYGDSSVHVNQREKIVNLEYFGRTMLLPVDVLQLRLTLPEQIKKEPFISVFECSRRDKISKGTVAPQDLLQLNPFPDSPLYFSRVEWKRASPEMHKQVKVTNPSSRTWEATVTRPPIGTVYAMDFYVPSVQLAGEAETLARDAQDIRKKLLGYAAVRRDQRDLDEQGKLIREQVREIAGALAYWFALDKHSGQAETFQVSVMTYDESRRRLAMVDGTNIIDGAGKGNEPDPSLWDFWLPFGLGVAGACFKQASRPFVYVRPKPGSVATGPDIYVPSLTGSSGQEVLVSVPVDHPQYKPELDLERSRQCIAVVTFGSTSASTKLHELSGPKETLSGRLENAVRVCKTFGNKLHAILHG